MKTILPPATAPTNFPTGTRRTAQVVLPARRPDTVAGVFRAAARILASNGLYQGDYVPDRGDREMSATELPHSIRPMSIVAALKCAAAGDPHRDTALANEAIGVLALRLELNGEVGPHYGDIFNLGGTHRRVGRPVGAYDGVGLLWALRGC
ncbi:hypothetical protein OG705_29170 [Streptomyces sp. NBC_00838]|uniref:DUF6197 family protein n=1 Tax=Streptomyces sp. NBC_00838 TaxID=2903680 RepID=UPI003869F9D9|nr:hypothetical protein OG705_29170 [Streptomyces sp. NBC_00838]